MKKRILALLLVLCLLLGTMAGWIERDQEEPELPVTYTVEDLGYDRTKLSVATFTPLTGHFFTDMWGNGSSDADVKKLLHGYPLAAFDMTALNYAINEDAVSGFQITADRNGNREYNIFLCEDLYYSDGSRITAWDYAFSILMQLNPATAEIGADRPDLSYIIGASDYSEGRSDKLTGVRVISDTQIKISVNKNAFPYYYELSYIAFNPYPISVIAPGAGIADDGKGVYLTGYTAAELKQTVLNARTGYMTFPSVVSGPYKIVSFDGTTAEFTKNEYYKGSDDAEFAQITYTAVSSDTAASALSSGSAALIHKAMNSGAIVPLTQLMTDGVYTMSAYPRSGLSFISFCCEQKPVSDKKVRQAIAMCLDKEAMAQSMVGNYGTVIDGYYGIGQWMYQIVSGAEPYPTEDGMELAKWQALSFDNVKTYAFDPTAAGQLLQNAGWKKNSDGIRAKKIGSRTVTLDLTMVVPESSAAVDFLKNDFTDALRQAGIKLTVKVMPWEDMLKLYYREEERTCDMFFLASNFDADFNPASWFATTDGAQGVANKTGIRDDVLYTYAKNLVKTDPNDTVGYCTKWVKFLEYMSDVMPVIPIYSNIYFDYYTSALTGYEPSAQLSWADGILGYAFENVTFE